jgi:hypothetical protein
MATNVFFRNYDNFNEQNLIDDLVIESIQIYGLDVIYVTRSIQGEDSIFNEDDMPLYDETFNFEAYVKNVDGFEGEGDFLSKFGLEIRDSVTFTVAIRTFERFVTKEDQNKVRPLEGDIIFFPLNQKMYEIKYVEHESVFYQSGALQVYDLRCELIEASGQRFDTGIPDIDEYFTLNNMDVTTASRSTLTAVSNTSNSFADNLFIEQAADDILDFSETDPFSEVLDIQDS